MKKEYKELKEDVLDEEKAIEETLKRLNEVKNNFRVQKKEDYLSEPAMGTYLMNFYNGIENILKQISRSYYLSVPKGNSWHKELLVLSSNPPAGKVQVFNQTIMERIVPYRNFRHRFVSGYGFQLKAEKMMALIDNAESLWGDVKRAVSKFLDKL
ncbi:MAG: hypothetical protein L6245_02260 [Thermodesulfovibrionales bacterium]|nr:hypothetical protein [Thermodesulfovibrionales bacterium]